MFFLVWSGDIDRRDSEAPQVHIFGKETGQSLKIVPSESKMYLCLMHHKIETNARF